MLEKYIKIIRIPLITIILQIACYYNVDDLYAVETSNNKSILIISSYNPHSSNISRNISEFIEEHERLEGASSIIIENMNCLSYSEHSQWKGRMKDILNKYKDDRQPACVILLGQEANASYLSQDIPLNYNIPVFSAMASRNAIKLFDNDINTEDEIISIDIINSSLTSRIHGGLLYNYDVEKNIGLIQRLYPQTEHIAFLSDNSYGGVSLQALVKSEMKKFPELNLILLDGRNHTIYTITDELLSLPPNTVLLLGTWRVDRFDGYFMQNVTYSMMEVVPTIPAFSLTSLGMGHWAIGGYIPNYENIGKLLARQVVNYFMGYSDLQPSIIKNQLLIDNQKIDILGINRSILPVETILINIEQPFYQKYKFYIWISLIIFGVLVIGLMTSIFFYSKTLRMKNILIASEAELRASKEKAEESDRLKSAFLANMSHEIRTPLNAIVGFTKVLTSKKLMPEQQQQYGDIIKSSSDLLLRLINDVLDISKLEAETIHFEFQKHDVVTLIYTVLSTFEMSHTNRNKNRYVFYHECEEFIMDVDEQRMQQVLINLLSNATKFTKMGIITIDFEIDANNNQVLFSVFDTGSGIPEVKQKAVFERFEKLNNFEQGTGLGLPICKLITAKWGGDIWLDSQYTDGARFVFSHPLNIEKDNLLLNNN